MALSFGDFYLCDTFVVSELHDGIHFDWSKVTEVAEGLFHFYGENMQLGYISNRVNSYSLEPQSWSKVQDEYSIIVASAIVSYNNLTYMNATLEKQFSKKSIKRCTSLEVAINWITSIKEFS
ncbi:hypothetical protein [Changchengzhania lutea]|uniref:hypothetical protein n=1 Tax=Changchengzhania lutea TaxID=2049305 RepID=UPI001FE68B54|nr:hypothetical protein [Changchengzhania lutea]